MPSVYEDVFPDGIYYRNDTEQGTGCNPTHYPLAAGAGGHDYAGEPPYWDFNKFGGVGGIAGEGQIGSIEPMINCCPFLPETILTHGYEHGYMPYNEHQPYTHYAHGSGGSVKVEQVGVAFNEFGKFEPPPINCDLTIEEAGCNDVYAYMNACGCPEAELWEGFYDKALVYGHAKKILEPAPSGFPPLSGKGAYGFHAWTDGKKKQEAKYSLRINNLVLDAAYKTAVLFTSRRIGADGVEGAGIDPTCIHTFIVHTYTADECIEYLDEIDFPETADGYFTNLLNTWTQHEPCLPTGHQ